MNHRIVCAWLLGLSLTHATLAQTPAPSAQAPSTAAPVAAASGPPQEVTPDLPQARMQGNATLRVIGFHIYDARLWAGQSGVGMDWGDKTFAVEITLGRNFRGISIAKRALVEMKRVGEVAEADAERWFDSLKSLFPDVREGDRFVGVHVPGQGMKLFFNGSLRGEVREPAFVRHFFGIWLSPQTGNPEIRDALLGRKP